MSTATATAVDATPPKKGKKKLIIILAASLAVLLLAGGGASFVLLKKKAAAAAEAQAEGEPAKPDPAAKREAKGAPVFAPLDTFTVNLADREAERYAQIGITLELEDAKAAEQIKQFMPAIRNNILMAIADKTAAQLMDRDGKRRLALEVRRETSRALGYDVPEGAEAEGADGKPARKKTKDADAALPVRAVHFSNFIIQ